MVFAPPIPCEPEVFCIVLYFAKAINQGTFRFLCWPLEEEHEVSSLTQYNHTGLTGDFRVEHFKELYKLYFCIRGG